VTAALVVPAAVVGAAAVVVMFAAVVVMFAAVVVIAVVVAVIAVTTVVVVAAIVIFGALVVVVIAVAGVTAGAAIVVAIVVVAVIAAAGAMRHRGTGGFLAFRTGPGKRVSGVVVVAFVAVRSVGLAGVVPVVPTIQVAALLFAYIVVGRLFRVIVPFDRSAIAGIRLERLPGPVTVAVVLVMSLLLDAPIVAVRGRIRGPGERREQRAPEQCAKEELQREPSAMLA
jgi:hypothetical protein